MNYVYKATKTYWRRFYDLPPEQKNSVRKKWKKFKEDPFDPSLKTHKIHKLSAEAKQTVWSVVIECDLRALFVMDSNVITTIDIGTHSAYR